MTQTPTPFTNFVAELNHSYDRVHTLKEEAFWAAYMGLTSDADKARKDFNQREIELKRWLQDPAKLEEVRAKLTEAEAARTNPDPETNRASDDELLALQGWVNTLQAHVIESAEARAIAENIVELEGALARSRGNMKLGYHVEGGEFTEASSVQLGVMLRGENQEPKRKAAWEGLRSIEPHVLANGFIEIVKQRNRLGRMMGGEDFYDATVKRTEGLSKAEIFELLDELEAKTRDAATVAIANLKSQHGAAAVTPWNMQYLVSGDVTADEDPYFPISKSFDRWGRSFAALGIGYNNAELVLDLLDRKGKHENGFMHGPVCPWRDRGVYRPARIQFTANAIPGLVGSGRRATETFFHEGGHAAHFANIDMPAPCFSQEFAPTSVAFAEVQSMFLDSLIGDADWQTRYARTADDAPMPFELMERSIRARQPFAAWTVRAMLTVPYAERAIYELPEDQLTPENIINTIREVEQRLTLLDAGARPVLSVPHLLSGESGAYYHGYVLAEMGVHQTRDFFLNRDGRLVDNPAIGPDLAQFYWSPGNSRRFLEFIPALTGQPLSADYLANHANRSADEALADAKESIAKLEHAPIFDGEVNFNANIRAMHGNELVAGGEGKTFAQTAKEFDEWITGMLK